MFLHRVVNDGSIPLKYKRGKHTKKKYTSRCLGYKFKIPEGFAFANECQLKDRSTPDDTSDLYGVSSEGIEVGVNFIPADGSYIINDTNTLDRIGRAIEQKVNNENSDRHVSYYGVTEFCGKKCVRYIMEYTQNGEQFFAEYYQNYTTYYVVQFSFIYTYDNAESVSDLKSLFSAL